MIMIDKCLIKKYRYFVYVDLNPMSSNSKFDTS